MSDCTNIPNARPLRVCHVSLTLCTGGLERLLADFARFHDRDVVEQEFVAMRELGRFADEIRRTHPVHMLSSTGRYGAVRELAELFRRGQFDVVHTHNAHPHLYATLAARWAGVPVVVNTRHGQRNGQSWKSRFEFRAVSRLVDRMVAVSDDAARLSILADGVDPQRVMRIWNGIDVRTFAYRGPAEPPTAVTVARLTVEKDLPTLLAAMPAIVAAVPAFKLMIVGDGAERGRVEQIIRDRGLQASVELLGERKDIPEQLARAAIYISSSKSEGISLTILEAMAVGLPVVATAAGGNPEIVEHGRTGLVVPVGDHAALAQAVIAMCGDRAARTEMGRQGRDRVERHFDVRQMCWNYFDLYRNLLAARLGQETTSKSNQAKEMAAS